MSTSTSAALLSPQSDDNDESAPFCRSQTPAPKWSGVARSLSVVAVLVVVQAIFGGYSIVVKLTMNSQVDALVFSLYRDVGASVVLMGACVAMGELKPILAHDIAAFLACGIFGVTISQTALVVALQWVPVHAVAPAAHGAHAQPARFGEHSR